MCYIARTGCQSGVAVGLNAHLIGLEGEALFQRLARKHWGEFEYTPQAAGTDGYLRWTNVSAERLFVQIKTSTSRGRLTDFLKVEVAPNHLREWYAIRPILVKCILDEDSAWWMDTAEENWPFDARKSRMFSVPLGNPVDSSTKTAIQGIALRRSRFLPPGVIAAQGKRPASAKLALVPQSLRRLTPRELRGILETIYAEIAKASLIERDGMALSAARLIHCNLRMFEAGTVDAYLALVLSRLQSDQQGGRSNTLIALTSLLRPNLGLTFDPAFLPSLQIAIDRAVTAGTYVNPEFGLILAASLAARFPKASHLSDHARDLASKSLKATPTSQNCRLRRVAGLLEHHLGDRASPYPHQFTGDAWLTKMIYRPLRPDDEIFRRFDQAAETAWRIVASTPARADVADLNLFNELTRLQASSLLRELQ
jgi:hypothetical protein